jgi:dTDP-4-amino-4,6-dideoxygalactose transaminase
MIKVEFLDLRRGTAALRSRIGAAIGDVLDAGRFVLGEKVEAFERAFARYCGGAYGVGTASGTDALRLALTACGVGAGDEVITVSNTGVPTVSAIASIGATPVFVDIDPATYTMDPELIESRVTGRTRAIVPVHLYGQCAEMDGILAVARRHGLRVVEDCAQAHGARCGGRMAGTMGDAGCYSFYPTKNLGALGDAGMVVTSDRGVAEAVRLGRNYGATSREACAVKGLNSRLDEIQAAILLEKLPWLDGWNERRRQIALVYSERLAGAGVLCPREAAARHHVYHLYVVRVKDREGFRARMAERGIGTLVHYPVPVHRLAAYRELAGYDADLPITNDAAAQVVSLPLYPELEDHEVEAVAAAAV